MHAIHDRGVTEPRLEAAQEVGVRVQHHTAGPRQRWPGDVPCARLFTPATLATLQQ
jgi:hypothetical protein